jgi:hypothetical protein
MVQKPATNWKVCLMIAIKFLHPSVTAGNVGEIPCWLSADDPRPAATQLDGCYSHGGGWEPFVGFRLREDNSLKYPGDRPLQPIAEMRLRDELILIYEHSWVVVIQPDRTFEACRMD